MNEFPPPPVRPAPPSLADSLKDVLARVKTTENRHLLECLTEDYNSHLSGLVRLSGKTRADPKHVTMLLDRWQMTLSMAEPLSQPSVADYAPPRNGPATAAGLRAVEDAVQARADDITRIGG